MVGFFGVGARSVSITYPAGSSCSGCNHGGFNKS